ncbi:unnamed protein product [Gordionus sp. m RMFG-2023]|uniref:pre-mRNA-splicing factor syf2-like n=1 Tax=Gordionus sp. m RMFG-2023 TaxID=3053472 RepID=UPI0030E36CB1
MDVASKKDKLERLRLLHQKREEAQRQNYKEVVEEDRKSKLPSNWEVQKRKIEWEVDEEKKKKEAIKDGQDYDRLKALNIPAEIADQNYRKRNKKRNPDPGFSSFEEAAIRKYQRLSKQIKPDKERYERMKKKMGQEFYPTSNTLLTHLEEDPQHNIDKMAEDIKNQIEKGENYSRRRTFNPDADIDYINERNMKFNKKLDHFYSKYTEEIKQNLERGTAL